MDFTQIDFISGQEIAESHGRIDKFIQIMPLETEILVNGVNYGQYSVGPINTDTYTLKLTPVWDLQKNVQEDAHRKSFTVYAPTGYENCLLSITGESIELIPTTDEQ